jgi:septal ring factor EnvC (AmiA/AmiB activator)
MLFYGGQFANTILFYQAISVAGLPLLSRCLSELTASYRESRDSLKRELPEIIEAEADLADIAVEINRQKESINSLKKALNEDKISLTDFEKKVQAAKDKIITLKTTMDKTNAIQNSLNHMKESIDPQHIQVRLLPILLLCCRII